MEKIKTFIKELRVEYKILIVFILILLISIPFTAVKKYSEKYNDLHGGTGVLSTVSDATENNLSDTEQVAPENEEVSESTDTEETNNKPSSISEAINSNRPLIISENESGIPEDIQSEIFQQIPETKGIEMATKVENPTIWVYTLNDGNRKDQEAAKYCVILSNRGIIPNSVFIYDEKERGKGNLAELGFAKCMN